MELELMIFSNSILENISGRKLILKVMIFHARELVIQQLLNTINKKETKCTYLAGKEMKESFKIHGNLIFKQDNGHLLRMLMKMGSLLDVVVILQVFMGLT